MYLSFVCLTKIASLPLSHLQSKWFEGTLLREVCGPWVLWAMSYSCQGKHTVLSWRVPITSETGTSYAFNYFTPDKTQGQWCKRKRLQSEPQLKDSLRSYSLCFPSSKAKNESGKGGLGGNLPEQGRACQCQLTGPWRKSCGLAEQFLFLFRPLEESQLAQLPSERSPDSITKVTNDRLEDSVSSWMETWKPSLFGQTDEQNLKNRTERTTLLYQQYLISMLPIFSKCSAFPKINMQYLLCQKT